MRNRFTAFTMIFFTSCSLNLLSQTLKFEDNMNGDNSVAGLQARGWIVLNEDGGGSSNPWFQGRVSVFNSFEGPDSGYVAANFNGANANDVVDQWLISPILNISLGDSLSFLARSPDSSDFDDSIYVMLSTNAGTTPADFISLGRYLVSKNGWQRFYWISEINATIRVAIRYYLFDALTNADYIGLDLVQVHTKGAYPLTISINKSFGFTNITQASSYRMIGLPGNIDLPISASGTRKTDWNAFWDNGAAADYLVEYDGSANFNFKPGKGFWLLSKNAINVNVQVNSVALAGDNTYSISLHNGWNIISNPFERSTNWAAVQTANGLAGNDVIHDWGGTWTNPTSFTPYKAYYFNNTGNLPSLKIPYDPSGTLPKASIDLIKQIYSDSDVKFSLIQNEKNISRVFIGYNPESTNDFDKEDYFAPPGDFEIARIVLRNNSLSTSYKYLMRESRSKVGEGQSYDLEVKNLTGEELICKIEGVDNHKNYLIYLVDERLNNEIKISENMEFKVAANAVNNNYKFLIGTEQFIKMNKGNLTPSSFALYQNYPNPFNPVTVIRYSVPVESRVTIIIFDVLGNEITQINDGIKSPGNYEIEFNAGGLASGVYVYQIKAGSFTDSKKMIFLR